MRTRAPGPLMRGVLFLIKDGQAIITIIIRSCTMENASLSNGWENPHAGGCGGGGGNKKDTKVSESLSESTTVSTSGDSKRPLTL